MTEEIMQIVTKESKIRPSSKPNAIRSKTGRTSASGKILNPIPKERLISGLTSVVKFKPESARPQNFIRETIQKKRAEEEIIRLAIERRNKENERDCVKKMSEANEMAEHLGIAKCYSAFHEETDGSLICRVYNKTTKKTIDLDLKKFVMEHKRLLKLTKVRIF